MKSLPRFALSSAGLDPAAETQHAPALVHRPLDHRPVLWALLGQLEAGGIQPQCYFSEARFPPVDGMLTVCGRTYRHLDPWLMSPEIAREVLLHGARSSDLAIVEDAGGGACSTSGATSIDQLAQWLNLPRLWVVDAGDVDPCRLPPRPRQVDGILLTGAADRQTFARQRLRWESIWGAPVFGGLIGCGHIQAILRRLAAGARPSAELCRALAENFVLTVDVEALLALSDAPGWMAEPAQIFRESSAMAGLNVAVAFDAAFGRYFADALDLLELNGARLREFSPLNDPDLPSATDVVYFGCGNVECYAEALAANPCMMSALRRHAQSGGRIYAEGGAAAYLCEQVELEPGRRLQMCGIMPAAARLAPTPAAQQPVEIVLNDDCWLGRANDRLRGYRNARWRMQPTAARCSVGRAPPSQNASALDGFSPAAAAGNSDLLCLGNVIASQVHLNLVAQPHLLKAFALSRSATAAVR